MARWLPSPSQAGQAPNGLLKENSRGSISGMVKPDTGQANFSEKRMRSWVSFADLLTESAPVWLASSGLSANSATARPVGELQRRLDGVGQPRREIAAHDDAVDHDVDVVLVFLVERRHVGDLVEGAVDLDALKPLLLEFGQLLAVLALAAAHDRRQDVEPRAFVQRQHAVDHLADRLAFDRQAGRRRIGNADAREEQPHVVVDLGDGADRRARIARRRLLLDRDGGRQAVDLVDIRLLHHFEELPRIGRQALDITALALGIDRVEGERRLARTGQAGHHDQRVARQVEIDVLQIVFARAANGKVFMVGHAGPPPLSRNVRDGRVCTGRPLFRYFRRNVEGQSPQALRSSQEFAVKGKQKEQRSNTLLTNWRPAKPALRSLFRLTGALAVDAKGRGCRLLIVTGPNVHATSFAARQAICETPQISEKATGKTVEQLTKERGMTPPDSPERLH